MDHLRWLKLRFVAVPAILIAAPFGAMIDAPTPTKTSESIPQVSDPKPPAFVPGEVLVMFKPDSTRFQRDQLHLQLSTRVIWRSRRLLMDQIRSTKGESTETLIQRYQNDPLVHIVEPNYIIRVASIPDDTYFGDQWALRNTGQTGGTSDADIDGSEAWDNQTGSTSVIVAVLDTGVNYNHPDLSANIWANNDDCGDGIDDDGNGKTDDCRGWNFVPMTETNNPMDDAGHGTHVAGIIAAVGDNNAGIAGVGWSTKIMALKTHSSAGGATTGDINAAIEYAIEEGAQIINLSSSGTVVTDTMYEEIRSAKDADVLFVCAAGAPGGGVGTDNDSSPWYPCAADRRVDVTAPGVVDFRDLTNIICVTSTDHNDDREGAANYGAMSVDLGAPGVSILSTALSGGSMCVTNPKPGGTYAYCTGTSMATPYVSGAAALLLAERPTATFLNLKWSIMTSVDDVDLVTVTEGRLNANAALTKITSDITSPSTPTNLSPTGSATPSVSLTWTASSDNVAVHHYEVWRLDKATELTFSLVGTPTGTSFSDTSSLVANRSYVYAVYAVDAAGNRSGESNREFGTTVTFTDASLTNALIRDDHITQLRTAVGYARTAAGLGVFSYNDAGLTVATPIRAVHITDLRTALDAAGSELGTTTGGWTDTPVTNGAIRAVHVEQIRARVQ